MLYMAIIVDILNLAIILNLNTTALFQRPEICKQILYVLGRSKKIEELVLENCGLKW